jgi:exosortase K
MKQKLTWGAQLLFVLLCALGLKHHYSVASPDQLRWILSPTTFLVELVSGTSFSFESYSGYMSSDHTFLIAGSCAGVNFLITAFLMLTLGRLWKERQSKISWSFIPVAGFVAYVTTILANTVRICVALHLRQIEFTSIDPNKLHLYEGIVVYFAFLLMLFMLTERVSVEKEGSLIQRVAFPLLTYYAIAFGVPLLNGGYKRGFEFWQHSLFVLVIPLVPLILSIGLKSIISATFFQPISFNQRYGIAGGCEAAKGRSASNATAQPPDVRRRSDEVPRTLRRSRRM